VQDAGTYAILGSGAYALGDKVTLSATTQEGYSFVGWYDGETRISQGETYLLTLTKQTANKTFVAKWQKDQAGVEPDWGWIW
jgi:uncharacterized repeat protein (TIGR02543 family)